MAAVTRIPKRKPLIAGEDSFQRIASILFPARLLSPLPIDSIPKRKNATPPSRETICVKSILNTVPFLRYNQQSTYNYN